MLRCAAGVTRDAGGDQPGHVDVADLQLVARDQGVDLLEDGRGRQRLPRDGLHGHQARGARRDPERKARDRASLPPDEADHVTRADASSARGYTPSSSNSGPVTTNPYDAYQSRSPVCASSLTSRSPITSSAVRTSSSASPRPRASGATSTRPIRAHSPSSSTRAYADEGAVGLAEQVAGGRLAVASVEVGVRRLLLDDEHLLPQAPHVVRRVGVELVERQHPHGHRRLDHQSTVCLNATRASGRYGSNGYTWIRPGVSTAVRSHPAAAARRTSSRQPGASRSRVP